MTFFIYKTSQSTLADVSAQSAAAVVKKSITKTSFERPATRCTTFDASPAQSARSSCPPARSCTCSPVTTDSYAEITTSNKVGDRTNDKQQLGQWLWLSWLSGLFRPQRSAVRFQSSVILNITIENKEHLKD